MRDAVGEYARLPGAGAGDDEQRAVDVQDGLALRRIQAGEEVIVRCDGHASMLATSRGARQRPKRTVRREASGSVEHHDAVVVAREDRAGRERDAAELDGDVDFPYAFLGTSLRDRAERLDPDGQMLQHRDVADSGIQHEPDPPVCGGDACDEIADERRLERPASVDDKDTPVARPLDLPAQKHVVIEAADRGDGTAELGEASELAELEPADARGGILVGKGRRSRSPRQDTHTGREIRHQRTVSSMFAGCGVVPA